MSDNLGDRSGAAAPKTLPHQTAAVAADPIDVAVIAKLRSDYGDEDGSLLAELVEAFSEESRELQRATQGPDTGSEGVLLSQAAHRLKSAAGTLGAKHVVSFCQQIELAERAGDRTRSAQLLGQLMLAIVRARAVLKRIVTAAKTATPG
jgi:HPt (histidine-containing phosphotransfer) domain-containing protein